MTGFRHNSTGMGWPGLLLLIIVGVSAGGLFITLPPWSLDIDVGNEPSFIVAGETDSFQNFFTFHSPEVWGTRRFRWTAERGAVTVPAALRIQPLLVDIISCGCRTDGSNHAVRLLLNNREIARLNATAQWRRSRVLVPPDLAHPDHSLMVDLRSPTWTDASGRTLGLAVDRIVVRQPAPVPIADPARVLVVLAGVVVLAWWRRSLLLPALLAVCWLTVSAAYQPQLLARPVITGVLVCGLVLLWWADSTAGGSGWSVGGGGWARPALLAVAGVWLVLSPQVLGSWMIDDAYISFRYAQQFVQGNGLVFNVGERVEGYTNFLWTMIIAGVLAVGGEPVVVSAALTLLLAFVLLALTLLLAHHLLPGGWALAAPLLLSVNGSFLIYTTRGSGMETALFAALILATLAALLKQRWALAGLLAALTMLTRPDGALLVVAGGCYALWAGWRGAPRRSLSSVIRHALRYSQVFLAMFAPYFLWRWSYYGYLLPNTFYVKVSDPSRQFYRGIDYLWIAGSTYLLPLSALVGVAMGGWFWKRSNQPVRWHDVSLIGWVAALFSLYIVVVGGDWMPGARFFMPLMPLFALATVWGAAGVAHTSVHAARLAAAAVVVTLLILLARLPDDSTDHYSPVWVQYYAARRYREVGRWIHDHAPPGVVLATGVAGAMPYYAERTTIDILGLADEHIAHLPPTHLGHERPGHDKTDPEYVLNRRPEIIPDKGSSLLRQHPAFKTMYRSMSFDGPEGLGVKLYVRNDIPKSVFEEQSP